MKIGFLFNHDQVHQVAHSLPIAFALRARQSGMTPVVAATSDRIAAEIARLAALAGHGDMSIHRLGLTSRSSRLAQALLGSLVPARKLLIYRDNLPFFRSLDGLVVSERTSLILKSHYGLAGLPIILADHGAGDRAIGFGKSTARFDHVLAAGAKIRDRLIRDAGVAPERLSITGYAKFDLHGAGRPKRKLFDNDRPTILYNPHVSPHLSSWYRMGRAVLDHFLADDRYNLIFAPHVMLFQRPWTVTIDKLRIGRHGRLDARYRSAPNIHIDLGSVASTDMTYVDAADLYLGDVSSQVYEFLQVPRPCVFLDAHHTDWAGDANYAHWAAGPVVGDVADLGAALTDSFARHHDHYRPIQRSLFDYTFDLTEEPSATRAARCLDQLFHHPAAIPAMAAA